MSAVVSRSFFSKKVTRAAIGKLPSTADILIQTDDSVNMADFKNWATDSSVLLSLNDALESENVGSTSLGTQYFNRFATATLIDAKVIPTSDWLGRNLGSVGGEGDSSQTWIRKDFIDKFNITVSGVALVPVNGVGGFVNARHTSSGQSVSISQANQLSNLNNLISIVADENNLDFIVDHEPSTSGGTGATFRIGLGQNFDEVVDGNSTTYVANGTYTVSSITVVTSGSGYTARENLLILGSKFGGEDGVDDISVNDITLTGYNLTVEKSELDNTGLTISDYTISSVFQRATVTFIEQNQDSDEFYNIFFNVAPQSPISVGDSVTFERGSNSLWSKLNTGFSGGTYYNFYGPLERNSIHVNVVSAGSGDPNYPKYTRSIKIQTSVDLASAIPNPKSQQYSFFTQVYQDNPETTNDYEWDSTPITGYNKVATKTSPDGITYYEYYINFKYPSRVSIDPNNVLQYAFLYKNLMRGLNSTFILNTIPNKGVDVTFRGVYTSIGFDFPIINFTTDDVDSTSTNYPKYTIVNFASPNYYLWTNTDINDVNYPQQYGFNVSGMNFNWYHRTYSPSYNPNNPSASYTTTFYGYAYVYHSSSVSGTIETVRNKDRIGAYMYSYFAYGGGPTLSTYPGYEELRVNSYFSYNAALGTNGLNSETPIIYVSHTPLGTNSANRPRLMSDINSGGTTQNIIMSNLESGVQTISWNQRIGTSEPILTQTETRYYKTVYPSDSNIGSSVTINNITKDIKHYLKIDDEIIQFSTYQKVSENRYELTGVVRGALGTTAVAHTGTDTSGIDKIVYPVLELSTASFSPLNSDGSMKSSSSFRFFWRVGTYTVDPSYQNTSSFTTIGKPSSDPSQRFAYQTPLYGPCQFFNKTFQREVVSVNYLNNSIKFNEVGGLAPTMRIIGLIGLDANGTGNNAVISKIDFIDKVVYLESSGNIFDPNIPEGGMVGNLASFSFSSSSIGQTPYIALFGVNNGGYPRDVITYYSRYTSESLIKRYYLEPFPIGNRAYEDLYGTAYQAFISARNNSSGIADDDDTYFTPRSQTETFLIQASRDQFFSSESVYSERSKYLYEPISDNETIVLNDSSGIGVSDILYGPDLPSDGAIIWSIEQYSPDFPRILEPGTITVSSWGYSDGISYAYFFVGQNVSNRDKITTGSTVEISTVPNVFFTVTRVYYYSWGSYVYLNPDPAWNTYTNATFTIGSGYYSPAKVKVRTKRQVYRDIIIYDYSLSSFGGEPCARFKLKKSDIGNLQANISHISSITNNYFNPVYEDDTLLVLYNGSDYTAPVIGFENHPSETEYYYVYVNNYVLEQQETITTYNTFSRGIPSVLEIVNIRKIKDLSNDTPVNTEYIVKPIPNLNKNTRYSLDNGKVVWFSTRWNEGDIELNTYYVPDQYDPSVFWDLDKDDEARYFHVASADQKTYSLQASSGTQLLQTDVSSSFAFPRLNLSIGNAVYFTNIPSELSSLLNADTVYYVTAINSTTSKDISISTVENGTPISFPTGSGYNLKVRIAQILFKTFEATTFKEVVTLSNPSAEIIPGQKIYGPGITSPIFRTIIDVTRNTSGQVTEFTLDSQVNNNKNQEEPFRITGFNKITTQDTFNQSPENLDEFLVPPSGDLIVGNQTYNYTEVKFNNNSYTFTIPVEQLNTFYIKPQTKIAVKYPRLKIKSSINSSDTKIDIEPEPIIPRKFFKLVIYETRFTYYSYTALSEINLYYDGQLIPYTNATISGPSTSNQSNQTELNRLIDGVSSNQTIYDFNHSANGSTTYIIEFTDPVLCDGYSLSRGSAYYGSFPSRFELFVSEDGSSYVKVSEETYEATSTANETTGIRLVKPDAISSSYPQFGNIRIGDEIIYYGYRTKQYFGDCIIKENHSAGSIVSFSPYNAIKENSIIYNGMDEITNVRVVVTDTYAPNPTSTQQIKVAGLEVDNPYISIALSSANPSTKQANQNKLLSIKIDPSKSCTYIDETTLELEAGSILTELVNGDELIIQNTYSLGSGYKVALLKDGKSFYINKPTINTSISNSNGTNFRKMYIVDSEILSGLNDGLISSANKFNSGRGFKYIPLSGCLDIKPVKCLNSKYISFPSKKYDKTLYLSDTILDPETLTGLTSKYDENGNKNNGNYVLTFEGNDYEIQSIEFPGAGGDEEISSNFITNFQYGSSYDIASLGIDKDSSGNIYVLSTELYASSTTGDRIFLAKYNATGVHQWSRVIESPFDFDYRPEGLRVYNNQIYGLVRNSTDTSIHVIKYDTNGNQLAHKKISSGGNETPYGGFEFDSNGDLWITGTTNFPGIWPESFAISTTPDVGNNDDGYWTITLPWNINFCGQNYNTVYLNTNSVLSFQSFDAGIYSGWSESYPAVDKIYYGTADNSCQRIRYGITGTAPNREYHIVYEGTASTSGTLGAPNIFYEYVFYENNNRKITLVSSLNNRSSSNGANSPSGGGVFKANGERIASWGYTFGGYNWEVILPSEDNTTDIVTAAQTLYDGHNIRVVNNALRLSDFNKGYQANTIYTKNKYRWDRPFSISFNIELSDPSNDTSSGVFSVSWTKQNNKHGNYYYHSRHSSSSLEFNSFVFTGQQWISATRGYDNAISYIDTISNSTNVVSYHQIDTVNGPLSGTSPFVGIKQNVFYWMDYNPATAQMSVYYSKTNVKPASPAHTFTIRAYDSAEYYFSINAGGYYWSTYMDNIDLKEINVTFTDTNQVVWNFNDFNFLSGTLANVYRSYKGFPLSNKYEGGFIAKLDSNLNLLDNKYIGGQSWQWQIRDIKFDSQGNKILLIHMYGQFASVYKYSPTNVLIWQKTYTQFDTTYNTSENVWALQVDDNDNIYVLGDEYSSNSAAYNFKYNYVVVYKLNSSGIYQWGKVLDSLSSDYGFGGLDINKATGDIYVYGLTYGGTTGSDLFILKIDTDGNLLLSKEISSFSTEHVYRDAFSRNRSFKVYNNVAYFTGATNQGNTRYAGLFGSLNLSSPAADINGPYGDNQFTVGNLPAVFNFTNLPLQSGRSEPQTGNYGSPSFNTSLFLSISDIGDSVSSITPTGTTNTFGTVVDLTKKYIKVNITSPLKIDTKIKDTVIVKAQDYTTDYQRIPNVRGLVYGPQKAVLFDNYKSLIIDNLNYNSYVYTSSKQLKTKSSYSKPGSILSYVVLTNVVDLHAEDVFVVGTNIPPGTKVKSINYFDKVVYLTQPLSGPVSGNITFYVQRYAYTVNITSGNTDNISIGDTVSFIVSNSSTEPINIADSSTKYYVSNVLGPTSLKVNTTRYLPRTSKIMYVASSDGFSTRDFEIGAIELGGFKNNQRQQIVNTSIIADGTDGAIYDIETVQTRATREMFTKSIGTTLGRFVFKQRNFISKNRPIYWNSIPTEKQPIFDGRVSYITSGKYQDRPVFFSFSGVKIYWSFDGENWSERSFANPVKYVSYDEQSQNIFIAFNNGSFKSLSLLDIEVGIGMDYSLPGATTIKFIKRLPNYTFIQGDNGVFYTSVNPSSIAQDSIVWYSITLENNNNLINAQFDDYNYILIFDEVSQINFYKNFVLSNMTGANLDINVISDRIKGYNNVFTPIKTNAVTYGLGKFVEAGYRVLFQGVYQNPFIEIYEYENFSDITSPESPDQFDVKSLTYGDGQFICSGLNTNTNRQFIRYSPNGRVWYDVELYKDKIIPISEIIPGQEYIIEFSGVSNWTDIGSTSNLEGTRFIANSTTPVGDGTVIDTSSNLLNENEEITALEYGGFNIYIAAVQDAVTSNVRFIISSLPIKSSINLSPEDYDVDFGSYKIIESAGNTTLYKYKSSILDGNLLAWDGSNLVYFRYDSGAPVETNELNDYKIIGCQTCTYYEYNGLIVPDFRTAPEEIGTITDPEDPNFGDPIFTSAPLSLFEEGLIDARIVYPGSGYEPLTTFTNCQVGSNYGLNARITVSTNALGQIDGVTITNNGRFYSNLEEIQGGLNLLNNTGIDANGVLNNAPYEEGIEDERAIISFDNNVNYKKYSVYGAQAGTDGYALLYKNYLNSSLYYIMFFDSNGVFLDSKSDIFISDIAHLSSEFAFDQGL